MSSLALDIANRPKPAKKKGKPTPTITLGVDETVLIGGVEAKTINEASAEFAEVDRKIKELESRRKEIGDALKVVGIAAMREAEENGKYFVKALAGMAMVCRQNKYRAVDIATREELIACLGVVEYTALFAETARLEFDSINTLRDFVQSCVSVGIPVPAETKEATAPRSEFAERKCQLLAVLPEEKRAALKRVGAETTFAVSRNEE